MSGKKWVVLFICGVLCVVLFIGGVNYFVDPFGYFHNSSGDFEEYQESEHVYMRYAKAKYIEKHNDEYDAYIIGGSKSGALLTSEMEKIDGYRYYNCWLLSGNLREYLLYTQYIIEHTDAKKIVLHLSGPEVRRYNRESYGDMYKTPAVITGESEFTELISYLGKNVSESFDLIKDKLENGSDITNPAIMTGERNLSAYYSEMELNPQKYVKNYVLYNYKQNLKDLFKGNVRCKAIENNLNAMKKIKAACDEADVEVQVIIGATCITELYESECEAYWEYLSSIISIFGSAWDFSGFNSVNLNPYNFYNESHYKYEVGTLMIDTIAAGEPIIADFGQYITEDNKFDWLNQRKNNFDYYKGIYKEKKTISLKAYTYEDRVQ